MIKKETSKNKLPQLQRIILLLLLLSLCTRYSEECVSFIKLIARAFYESKK